MALAAMRMRGQSAIGLAKAAVAADPNLTWTYYFVERQSSDLAQDRKLELLERLQKWDPQNAIVYLAAAWDVPEDVVSDGRDPLWQEWMGRAFVAPKYDDYLKRRLELDRVVMRRLRIADPIDAARSLCSMPIISGKGLRDYSELRFTRGANAEAAGDWKTAAAEYSFVAHFADRMRLGGQEDIEKIFAFQLQSAAYSRLYPVLRMLGRYQEAESAANAARLAASERVAFRNHPDAEQRQLYLYGAAWVVHASALLALISSILLVVAVLAFGVLKVRSRLLHCVLTYAPQLLVLACAGMLAGYHPFARAFELFLGGSATADARPLWSFAPLFRVPADLISWQAYAATSAWLGIILTGSALCVWVVARSLRRQHA